MVMLTLLIGVCAVTAMVTVTGNPYIEASNDAQCLSDSKCTIGLDPIYVLRDSVEVQSDTFLRLITRKHLGVPIPIYAFHQPERLNPAQLPFKVVRVNPALTAAMNVVEIAHPQGSDSWFPGYTWSALLCQSCDSGIHLGWRFTNNLGSFDALIVDFGGEDASATAAPEAEGLRIGVAAPSWMLAAAAMGITARSR